MERCSPFFSWRSSDICTAAPTSSSSTPPLPPLTAAMVAVAVVRQAFQTRGTKNSSVFVGLDRNEVSVFLPASTTAECYACVKGFGETGKSKTHVRTQPEGTRFRGAFRGDILALPLAVKPIPKGGLLLLLRCAAATILRCLSATALCLHLLYLARRSKLEIAKGKAETRVALLLSVASQEWSASNLPSSVKRSKASSICIVEARAGLAPFHSVTKAASWRRLMGAISKAEGQRKLSQILSAKRKQVCM